MDLESEYRSKIDGIFNYLEKVFQNVDPDIAECEQSQGALVISFADRSKCILSAQPSVRQLWLALASRGTAYHFNYEASSRTWVDDKQKGTELFLFLANYFREVTGISFDLKMP